jgi:hypothetical protein
VSLFVNGVDPGFANDALPLVLSGISERIEEVRCSEVLNYNTYNQPMVLFDIMGFAQAARRHPHAALQPGVLTMAWGSVVRQIAAGLGVTLTASSPSGTSASRPPRTSRSTPARSRRARRPPCTSRCAAWWATRRSSCSSTSPACGTTWGPRGPSRPGRAATGCRSPASPTTPSTSSSWAPTATTTRPASRPPPCAWSTPSRPSWPPPGLLTALDLPLVTGRGLVVAATFPGEGWIRIADPDGRGPTILFHRVPEAKTVKNRVHLDLFVTPVDKGREHHALVDTEVGRLVALGATHRWTKADETDYFAVLHDPEGNEFCVV